MPIFDYTCNTCKKKFTFHKYKSTDKLICPNCKEEDEKKMTKEFPKGGSFVLKGKGWFKDGY